jgi:LacI family transcriptional regulator
MAKKLSIKDIAKELNVSITTVSFVLNGRAKEKRISEELTQKVLDLVKQTDYKPNIFARGLRTGKTKTIGLIVENIANHFFATIARLIEEYAYSKGYKIIYCSTDNDVQKTRELIGMLKERNVDGLIITPSAGIEDLLTGMQESNLPFVLFDRHLPGIKADYVVVDSFKGAYLATAHLLEKGYNKVAIITTDSKQSQMADRLNGYKSAVKELGDKNLIGRINFSSSPAEAVMAIKTFLEAHPEVNGIFFATNYLAAYGLEAITNLNFSIGDKIGIVAFDDEQLFRIYRPTITAVSQPIDAMAKKVIEILLSRMENKTKTLDEIVLQPELVERMSTKRK